MTHRRPAFTILELLTVVAIMGLLMAIVIPSLSAARRSAKTNVCLSHLRGLGTAFTIYLNENDDRFPPFRLDRLRPTTEELFVNGHGRIAPRWQWFLETDQGAVINPTPYKYAIDRVGYFHDGVPTRTGKQVNGRHMTVEAFSCPALDDERFAMDIRDGAYGYNYQYLGNTRRDARPDRWDNFAVGLRFIRSPARTVVLGDSRGASNRHGKHSYTLDPPRLATEVNARRFGPVPGPGDPILVEEDQTPFVEGGLDPTVFAYSPVEPRHNNLGNILFVDAHADTMSLRQLGYQFADGDQIAEYGKETVMPVHDSESGTYKATNELWNGRGTDKLALEHREVEEE